METNTLLIVVAVGIGAAVLMNKNKQQAPTQPQVVYIPQPGGSYSQAPRPTTADKIQAGVQTGVQIIQAGKSLYDSLFPKPQPTNIWAGMSLPNLKIA